MIFEKNDFKDLRKSSKGFWQVTSILINDSDLSIWTKVFEKKRFGLKIFCMIWKKPWWWEMISFWQMTLIEKCENTFLERF